MPGAGPGPGAQVRVDQGSVMMTTCYGDAHCSLLGPQSLQQVTWDQKDLQRMSLKSVFEAEVCLKACSCFRDAFREKKCGMNSENFCEKDSLHPLRGASVSFYTYL